MINANPLQSSKDQSKIIFLVGANNLVKNPEGDWINFGNYLDKIIKAFPELQNKVEVFSFMEDGDPVQELHQKLRNEARSLTISSPNKPRLIVVMDGPLSQNQYGDNEFDTTLLAIREEIGEILPRKHSGLEFIFNDQYKQRQVDTVDKIYDSLQEERLLFANKFIQLNTIGPNRLQRQLREYLIGLIAKSGRAETFSIRSLNQRELAKFAPENIEKVEDRFIKKILTEFAEGKSIGEITKTNSRSAESIFRTIYGRLIGKNEIQTEGVNQDETPVTNNQAVTIPVDAEDLVKMQRLKNLVNRIDKDQITPYKATVEFGRYLGIGRIEQTDIPSERDLLRNDIANILLDLKSDINISDNSRFSLLFTLFSEKPKTGLGQILRNIDANNRSQIQKIFDHIRNKDREEIYKKAKELELNGNLIFAALSKVIEEVKGKKFSFAVMKTFLDSFDLKLTARNEIIAKALELGKLMSILERASSVSRLTLVELRNIIQQELNLDYRESAIRGFAKKNGLVLKRPKRDSKESRITKLAKTTGKLDILVADIKSFENKRGISVIELQRLIQKHLKKFTINACKIFAQEQGITLSVKSDLKEKRLLLAALGLAKKYMAKKKLTYSLLNDIIKFVYGKPFKRRQQLVDFAKAHELKISRPSRKGEVHKTIGSLITRRAKAAGKLDILLEGIKLVANENKIAIHSLESLLQEHLGRTFTAGSCLRFAKEHNFELDLRKERTPAIPYVESAITIKARELKKTERIISETSGKVPSLEAFKDIVYFRLGANFEDIEYAKFAREHNLKIADLPVLPEYASRSIDMLITRKAKAAGNLETLLAEIKTLSANGISLVELQDLIQKYLGRTFKKGSYKRFAQEHGFAIDNYKQLREKRLKAIVGLANKYADEKQLTYAWLNEIIGFVSGRKFKSEPPLTAFAKDNGLSSKIVHKVRGQKKRTHGYEDKIREEACRKAGSKGITYHELNNIIYTHTKKYYKSMGALWKLAQKLGIPMKWDFNGNHLRSKLSDEVLAKIMSEAHSLNKENKLTASKFNKIIRNYRGLAMEDYELQVFALEHNLNLLEEENSPVAA